MTTEEKEILALYNKVRDAEFQEKSPYKPEPLPTDHKESVRKLNALCHGDVDETIHQIITKDMKENHPKNLDEAVDFIVKRLEAERLLQDAVEEGKGTAIAGEVKEHGFDHHGYGMGLRNSWFLWWHEGHTYYPRWPKEKPAIVEWFNQRNIFHADDMSGTINEALQSKLQGKEFDFDEHVKIYFKHWKKYGFKDGIFKPKK